MSTIKKISMFAATIALASQVSLVMAKSSVEQLEILMRGFSNYSANFEQYTKDEKGRKGEISTGRMNVQRPNKFRWETKEPFPQLIVSDGKNIWVYDPDLEQASRKQVSESETNGAALILNGDIKTLNKKFTITQLIDREREKLFELLPKQESNFERIQLFFAGKVMQELVLVDIFGKETTIVLKDAKLNQRTKSSLFRFKPPKGTDVMTDNGQ
jgi:outer membrane lipoprotein carrier protein